MHVSFPTDGACFSCQSLLSFDFGGLPSLSEELAGVVLSQLVAQLGIAQAVGEFFSQLDPLGRIPRRDWEQSLGGHQFVALFLPKEGSARDSSCIHPQERLQIFRTNMGSKNCVEQFIPIDEYGDEGVHPEACSTCLGLLSSDVRWGVVAPSQMLWL